MEYTFVLPVSFYRTSANEFACESAFARHLIELRQKLPPQFTAIRVCGPVMSAQEFGQIASHAGRIDERAEGIYLTGLNPDDASAFTFWTQHALTNFRKLRQVVQAAGLVHSGPSMNLFQPNEIVALLLARRSGRKTIAVVDIDIRKDSRRARQLGMISRGRYLAERLLFDPLRALQLGWVARHCSLVMFKGQALVDDYGRGRPSVKNFFDTAHAPEHVIPPERFERKLARVRAGDGAVRLVYFGRLVQRKGVDLCLRSVVAARRQHGANVSFTVIGDGPDKAALVALAAELQAQDFVSFQPPVPFGPALFDALYESDVLLAAPLTEDTPRSAFDAMAAGMALCAYDTEYYETLARFGPTVVTTKWMSVDDMARGIAALAGDRERLAIAQQAGRQLALDNTQAIWLDKRAAWTREFCGWA